MTGRCRQQRPSDFEPLCGLAIIQVRTPTYFREVDILEQAVIGHRLTGKWLDAEMVALPIVNLIEIFPQEVPA